MFTFMDTTAPPEVRFGSPAVSSLPFLLPPLHPADLRDGICPDLLRQKKILDAMGRNQLLQDMVIGPALVLMTGERVHSYGIMPQILRHQPAAHFVVPTLPTSGQPLTTSPAGVCIWRKEKNEPAPCFRHVAVAISNRCQAVVILWSPVNQRVVAAMVTPQNRTRPEGDALPGSGIIAAAIKAFGPNHETHAILVRPASGNSCWHDIVREDLQKALPPANWRSEIRIKEKPILGGDQNQLVLISF